jgi:hypothetical protein
LDEELEYVGLPRREPQRSGVDVHTVGVRHARYVGGQIDAAVQHVPHGIEEPLGIRALRDETLRAGAERRQHRRLVVRRGEHGDGHAGIVELEIGEKIESPRTGKREIEQNELDLRLVVEHFHRFGGISRGQDGDSGVELGQELHESVDDQRMIVDDENLHARLPLSGLHPPAVPRGGPRGRQ